MKLVTAIYYNFLANGGNTATIIFDDGSFLLGDVSTWLKRMQSQPATANAGVFNAEVVTFEGKEQIKFTMDGVDFNFALGVTVNGENAVDAEPFLYAGAVTYPRGKSDTVGNGQANIFLVPLSGSGRKLNSVKVQVPKTNAAFSDDYDVQVSNTATTVNNLVAVVDPSDANTWDVTFDLDIAYVQQENGENCFTFCNVNFAPPDIAIQDISAFVPVLTNTGTQPNVHITSTQPVYTPNLSGFQQIKQIEWFKDSGAGFVPQQVSTSIPGGNLNSFPMGLLLQDKLTTGTYNYKAKCILQRFDGEQSLSAFSNTITVVVP